MPYPTLFSAEHSTRYRERLLLAGILLGGLALRLFRLGADSLWYDETVSAHLAGSPAGELLRHTAGDIHPPGYYLLLRGWLLPAGYPDGRADPASYGLEWTAGFFSLCFGLALIALLYVLARRLDGPATGLLAAAIVALSPFNVWYSQEVRMYTLGACLGVVAIYAAVRAMWGERVWWAVYAPAAAAGMYTLYYFIFLLIPLNAWILLGLLRGERKGCALPWLAANLGALILYLPWLPNAIRQATDPPVPPWRSPTPPLAALWETIQATALGPSAPGWSFAIALMVLALFAAGVWRSRQRSLLLWTTLGPLALILLASLLAAPLYHVRYMFTFSPMAYVAIAGGLAWLGGRRRALAWAAALIWLIGAAVTLRAFWFDPLYRADDHRAAVARLYDRWRPGDAVLVNAGYAYTALATYWPGEIAGRTRLTDALPDPRADGALVMATTGHVDGEPGLGWGDPRSDFFAMPAGRASEQVAALFERFPRVWHYRIYDTVSDPDGLVRGLLETHGQPIEDATYSGESNMRLQGFVPRAGADGIGAGAQEAIFGDGLALQWRLASPLADGPAGGPTGGNYTGGDRVYAELFWRNAVGAPDFATSVRLVDAEGSVWAQPEDERPLGPAFPSSAWPTGGRAGGRAGGPVQRQPIALEIPEGTPPGEYAVVLVVYDPQTGAPYPANPAGAAAPGIELGHVTVARPEPSPALREGAAQFGPLRLFEATTPVTQIAPGGEIPVELLWQAASAPGEPLVVVLQLLDAQGQVVAGLEEEPLRGRHPTQSWAAGEIVRDRHTLAVPAGLASGAYRLVAGVYRAADRARLPLEGSLFDRGDSFTVKAIAVGP
jgi:hypothetical protein